MAQRSKPLHNFTMPTLRWGNQRFLRCRKVDSNGEFMSSSDRRSSGSDGDSDGKDFKFVKQRSLKSFPQSSKRSKIDRDGDDGIEQFRAKLMLHFRTASEKISIQEDESAVASAARPWNLRTRRAACKSPNDTRRGGSSKLDERKPQQQHNVSPQRTENPSPKSVRLRGLAVAATNQGIEKERRKFSTSLARDEIKEDLLMMTGNNPSRRPKKRARIIQKQLDNLFPGCWLEEITIDTYKVPDEVVETRKK